MKSDLDPSSLQNAFNHTLVKECVVHRYVMQLQKNVIFISIKTWFTTELKLTSMLVAFYAISFSSLLKDLGIDDCK